MSTASTCPRDVSTKASFFDMSFDPERFYDDLPDLPPRLDFESRAALEA